MKREQRIKAFVTEIWTWYAVHKRTLPWRDLPGTDPTERAYKVLVSEIMLQQTQVPRVIVTFRNFLERFPTVKSLADASTTDVLIAWKGMGYNSRALRLRDAAVEVVGRRKAEAKAKNTKLSLNLSPQFPVTMQELMAIKGIGPYTAAAIRNFAFGLPTPCIDTNIRRILHRTFVGSENEDGTWEKDDEYLLNLAEEILECAIHHGSTADWHAALMDFGSLIQTKRNPKWEICPLTRLKLMKANSRNSPAVASKAMAGKQPVTHSSMRQEPGRHVGSVFIPNRIFRGRVVDALRDAPTGLSLHDIGRQISVDWDPAEHHDWLSSVLQSLVRDQLIRKKGAKLVLG